MNLYRRIFGPKIDGIDLERVARWLDLQADSTKISVDTARYVVVDVETSGLDLRQDRLISIGAMLVQDGKLALGKGFHGILRQDRGSTRENILVHGIGDAEQTQGELPGKLLLEFLEYARKSPFVGFHAAFDRGFLQRAVRRFLGVRFANPFLDLAWLLPALFGGRGKGKVKGLDDWLQQFGLIVPNRHSADADALAAAELLLIALPAAKRRGMMTFQELSAFARREEEVTRAGSPGIV